MSVDVENFNERKKLKNSDPEVFEAAANFFSADEMFALADEVLVSYSTCKKIQQAIDISFNRPL